MTAKIPTVIGLGRLVDFIIRDAQGQRLRVTPSSELWLAWKSDSRDLIVLRPGQGQESLIDLKAAKRHKKFHGAAPEQARSMEWPKAQGKLRTLGLIESVTYCSTGIHSPIKKTHHWVHQFGDRGERKHGSMVVQDPSACAERLMPLLDVDELGNVFMVRRPDNL
jgi:hypothetical protein